MEKHICCICGKEFEGWGNNPWPYPVSDESDVCCDDCNMCMVIPLRITYSRRNIYPKVDED